MKTLVYVNPLKPGKLEAYKAFTTHNTGKGKQEYIDMLNRLGLCDAKVYYHTLGDTDFVIVIHEAEDYALERLSKFTESQHPYDRWFLEQLTELHDLTQAGLSQHIMSFVVKKAA
jgi:hypothetical protein